MNVTVHNGEVEITGVPDFNLSKTFECGQCFRWNKDETGVYSGVAFGHVARLRQCGENVHISCSMDVFEKLWRDYFDLDRDYAIIRRQLCVDEFMQSATTFGAGIRILRQDKWEALCSFIISQNNNIPRIKNIVEALCVNYGERFVSNGKDYYTFPSAQTIGAISIERLEHLRCGYRAAYISKAAKAVASGELDLEALSCDPPDNVRIQLKKLHGVGDKVADCMMLFGLHMLDVFPRDVWINRAVAANYGENFDPGIFSPYAGIAQQYIFHYTRNGMQM